MLSSHSTLKNKDKFDTAIDQQTQTEEEPPEIDQNIYIYIYIWYGQCPVPENGNVRKMVLIRKVKSVMIKVLTPASSNRKVVLIRKIKSIMIKVLTPTYSKRVLDKVNMTQQKLHRQRRSLIEDGT